MVAVAFPAMAPSVRRARATASLTSLGRSRRAAATYRRRRLGVGSLVLTMLLAGWAAVGSSGGGPLSAPEPTTALIDQRVHVVQPGDTLWSIARSLQPEGDVRRLVDRLATQRRGAALQVGERIALP